MNDPQHASPEQLVLLATACRGIAPPNTEALRFDRYGMVAGTIDLRSER